MKQFGLILLLCAALPAQAADAPKSVLPGRSACSAPIQIESDKFVADNNSKSGVWSGNVKVTQCDTRIRANSMRVNVVGNAPDKIFANGGVVVDSPASGTATGDNAVYDVKPRVVVLNGHVVLTHNKDVMRGPQLTVNLVTGQAQLGGGKSAPGGVAGATGTGRVQAIFSNPSAPPATTPAQGGN